MSTPAPGSVKAWILASRPPTLAAAVVPVAVGAAAAFSAGGLRLDATVAALFGAIWIQIGTNFANDVFDFEKGADTEARLGPTRAVQAGLLSALQMRRGMIVSFAVAALFGGYLVWLRGWPLVAIGVASIISGIAYTGGPFPLGYNGLGDLFVFVFFGLVAVGGTAFVSLGHVPEVAVWAAIPAGALATAILVVNNVRDRVGDRAAGKRTLAVRFGRGAAEFEYAALLLASYATPIVLLARNLAGLAVLLPLATAPLAVRQALRLHRLEGRDLNPVLVGSAQTLMLFGLLFAAGLALANPR